MRPLSVQKQVLVWDEKKMSGLFSGHGRDRTCNLLLPNMYGLRAGQPRNTPRGTFTVPKKFRARRNASQPGGRPLFSSRQSYPNSSGAAQRHEHEVMTHDHH
jgi:hypothetical protein